MVRSVSRSKGCARCLQRKVKCDEKQPQCSQCQRMRRPCPGPMTGSIFVHAIPTDRGPKAEKANIGAVNSYHEVPIAATTLRKLQSTFQPLVGPSGIYQPAVAPVFDQLFLSTFIETFTKPSAGSNPQLSWMNYLNEFLITGDAPIKHSIRAAATAFHSRLVHNVAAQRAAEHCYIVALRSQRSRLTPYLNGAVQAPYIPNDQEIFTSMMLLYFELISPSSTASWLKHLHGVTSLLQLRGAESCQVGAMHLLFRSLRLLEAYSSFRTRTTSALASDEWRTIPFAISGKNDTDKLVDILLLVPNLFKNMTAEKVPFFSPSTVSVEGLLSQLRVYEERYIRSILLAQEANRSMNESSDDDEEDDDCNGCNIGWIDGGGDFCTAMPESLFYSAKILVDHVAFGENVKSLAERLIPEQLIYSSLLFRIAEVAQDESRTRLNAGSCVQLAFCLEVVESFGSSASCRDQARIHLQHLGWEKMNAAA